MPAKVKVIKNTKTAKEASKLLEVLAHNESPDVEKIYPKLCQLEDIIFKAMITLKVTVSKLDINFGMNKLFTGIGYDITDTSIVPDRTKDLAICNARYKLLMESHFTQACRIMLHGKDIDTDVEWSPELETYTPLYPFVRGNLMLTDIANNLEYVKNFRTTIEEYFDLLATPNGDTSAFVEFLTTFIDGIKKINGSERCLNAIKFIHANCNSLAYKYPEYYRRAFIEDNINDMFNYFIDDVRLRIPDKPSMYREFKILAGLVRNKHLEARAQGLGNDNAMVKCVDATLASLCETAGIDGSEASSE